MFKPWVVLGALVACDGGVPPDFVSSRGTEVYLNGLDAGFTRESVDAMEDFNVEHLVAAGWDREAAEHGIRGAWVDLQPDRFDCTYAVGAEVHTGKCYGQTLNHSQMLLAARACPFWTAFRHEQLHHLLFTVSPDGDSGHTRPEWASVVNLLVACDGTIEAP